MVSLIMQVLVFNVTLVVAWKVLRWLFVKSPLERIPGPPALSFIGGNVQQIFHPDGWDSYYDILNRYGPVARMKGFFGEDVLFIFDPKALYHITIKDQHIYEKTPATIGIGRVMFGEGLNTVLGEQHRKQRKILNPVFSIAHMRAMMPIFYEVTHRLREALWNEVKDGSKEVDVLHWMSRTALELIGQSGMGYSFDSLADNEDMACSRYLKRFSEVFSGPRAFISANYIVPLANKFNFPRLKRWIVEKIPSQWLQDMKDIVDIIEETAKDICKAKQNKMDSGESDESKKDVISLLMRANANATMEDRLSDKEVIGQVSTLIFAATDTTSSALSRILYLLTKYPDVQEKLRTEVLEAKHNSGDKDLDYDQLVTLPYLDAVCRETLRLHPPIGTNSRIARKDMILPLSKPLKTTSGEEVTELIVPNGTTIFTSILGANTNPELWGSDSYEWKPERWLKPPPQKLVEAHMPGIYSNLMTFFGGSRACIGFKFSQLEMKVVLSLLLTSFKFEDAGKSIKWRMSGIVAPVVEGKDHARSELPMILTRMEKK